MVGAGSLPLWPTLMAAALGAIAGDGLSYELGRRYQERIRAWPLFQRRKASVARGETFVRRHGGKSIVLARFTGPVRAFVPLLVGFGHMPRRRFYPINVFSAPLWVLAHILPGVIFGTSLQVAEAVSGRLAIIAGLLFALIWFAAWLVSAGIRFGVPLAQRARDAAVAHARGSNTLLSRLTLQLLDPSRPGSHALLLGTVLLVGAGWLFFGVLQDVLAHDPLVAADRSVFNFLQGLRTPAVDRLLVTVTGMGSVRVLFLLVGEVTLWMRGAAAGAPPAIGSLSPPAANCLSCS